MNQSKNHQKAMYILILAHLFVSSFLLPNAAFEPFGTEGCCIQDDSHQDLNALYHFDIFADNNDDDDDNDTSIPLAFVSPAYLSAISFNAIVKEKNASFPCTSMTLPQQRLFLLYKQMKLDC